MKKDDPVQPDQETGLKKQKPACINFNQVVF